MFRIITSLFLILLIVSCASTEKHMTPDRVDEPGYSKYDAWSSDASAGYEAIKKLLDETDRLIEKQAFDAASDKLERILRIKPQYAPAWSRLSWLALQVNSPERSVQMAKRSNSFAFSDTELQLLNWSFIRDASQLLNDEESYHRANQKIESLKAI
ncbi:MAG: hypothetical protein U9P00_06640 [Pseudomonadota bacterium]|nr:hypothetical protein [Pseudomonadota bacterium]